MGNLSRNFSSHEFTCSCSCGLSSVNPALVEILQDLRDHFKATVKVTSGLRCESLNERVGGSPTSKHMSGDAADIKVAGYRPSDVYDYLDDNHPDTLGLGLYRSWVHVDVRVNRARWDKT